jgi:hypothetical protein
VNRFSIPLVWVLALGSLAAAQSSVPEPKELASPKPKPAIEEAKLGPTARTADLESSYKLLSDSGAILVLGSHCSNAGQDPEGKIAARKIADAGRYDLLEKLLGSPNKIGRTYAALELHAFARAGKYKPSVETRDLMKGVLNSADEVDTCLGCIYSRQKPSKMVGLWDDSLAWEEKQSKKKSN